MALNGLRSCGWRDVRVAVRRINASRQLSQPAAAVGDQDGSPPKPYSEIPGPKGYPLIGTALDYAGKNMSRLHVIIRERYDKFGPIYREKLFPGLPEQVIIFDPDDVEKVFRADGEWPHRPEGGEVFRKVREEAGLDPGILQLQGKEWHDQRMPMSKFMMVPRKVGEYHKGLNDITLDLMKYIRQRRDADSAIYKDVSSLLFKWAFESVSFFSLGRRLGALDMEGNAPPECQEFIDTVGDFFELTAKMFLSVPVYRIYRNKLWRGSVKAQRDMKDLAMMFITKRLDEIEEEDKKLLEQHREDDDPPLKVDFLTYLVHSGKMSLNAITANVIDLMMAGVDTTSYTLMWCLYSLARNPEAQERLRSEVREVVGDSKIVTPEHIGKMTYLRNVVKETQRLYPIAGFNQRIPHKDIVLSGYTIPKGTEILMPTIIMGHMPELFSNPEEFSPDRWNRDHRSDIHMFASLPFGTGPRMCVGRRLAELELNIALSQIMNSFKVEFTEEKPVEYVFKFLLVPGRPVNLTFKDL